MFLTSDQVQELTGYKKPALQCRWLTEHGYNFDVRGDGRPSVLEAQVRARQLKGLVKNAEVSDEPNFAALDTKS